MIALPAAAQPSSRAALDPGKALTQYIHRVWSNDEGLPQATVNAIAQTPHGFLWFGTEEGLVRFDGTEFRVYSNRNVPEFPASSSVKALAVDSDGTLWIGSRGGGLITYADRHFAPLTRDGSRFDPRVTKLSVDGRNRVWIATADEGIFIARLDGSIEQFENELLAPDALVTDVLVDSREHVWIGTSHGLLHVSHDHARFLDLRSGLPDAFVTALYEDAGGRILIGTRNGPIAYVDGELSSDHGLPRDVVAFDFAEDRHGGIFVGTDGNGLVRADASGIEDFATTDGLSHDRVMNLFVDDEGSLWIGTEGGGVNQLVDGLFTVISSREGLPTDMIMTVATDDAGALWLGTEGYGAVRIGENGRQTRYSTSGPLTSDVILSVHPAHAGGVWIGSYGGGLTHLRDGHAEHFNTSNGFPSDAVFAIHEGSDATWAATDAGVVALGPSGTRVYGTDQGLTTNQVTSLFEDASGRVWIGTMHGGLNLLDDDEVTAFGMDDGLKAEIVTSLLDASDGGLWIATYGDGLIHFRDGAFHSVTTRQGLPSNNIYQILRDEGRLWMSSNHGIFSVEEKAVVRSARGELDRVDITVYDKNDGLPSLEMNGGVQPAGWRAADGTLWFPSVAGVVGLQPDKEHSAMAPPSVTIESVLVDETMTDHSGELEIAPTSKKVVFHFVAPTFTDPEDVNYLYMLEGYDETWNHAGTDRSATYTNLDPGKYTFKVLAENRHGLRSPAPTSYSFYRKPSFTETPYFWISIVLSVIALAILAHVARERQLRTRQEELERVVNERTQDLRNAKSHIEAQADKLRELDRFKSRFFVNISHEFRTPLTLMVGPLQNVLAGAYGMISNEAAEQMRVVMRNSLRLHGLINQLLDISKLESGKMNLRARSRNLVPFLESIASAVRPTADNKGINLIADFEDREVALYYEPDKLEKVFFNLLSNALKFTASDGSIRMFVDHEAPGEGYPEGAVIVGISDSGCGIPPHHLESVFDRFRQVDDSNTREHGGTGIGLALVKELVLLHKGDVSVTSEIGVGTTFVVRLPKGHAHLETHEISTSKDEADPHLLGDLELSDLHELESSAGRAAAAQNASPADAPTVLVVDDNPEMRDYVASCLMSTYRVLTAVDGVDGLRKVRDEQPDVVVADIMMPRKDGYELCRDIRSIHEDRHVPVILLSAKASQETVLNGLESGADDYMAKPFSAEELRARIKNQLTIRQQERELKRLNDNLQLEVEKQLDQILNERRAHEARLVQEKQKAEEASRLKSAILDNMSHEFRTPLTGILGFTEVLYDELDEDHHESIEFIRHSGHRLLKTLSAILDLSRLEAAQYDLNPATIDVVAEVDHVVNGLARQANDKGLVVRTEFAESSIPAQLDQAATARIVEIVMDNALKFTNDGEVVVSVASDSNQVTIEVRDTGIGISSSFLPRLFAPFEQESLGHARDYEGNGVCLSVAKRLVDLSRGSIDVESEKGEGTTVRIRLPLERPISGDGASVVLKTQSPQARR